MNNIIALAENKRIDVRAVEYIQISNANSAGATISPYLAPWTGLWPKHFS